MLSNLSAHISFLLPLIFSPLFNASILTLFSVYQLNGHRKLEQHMFISKSDMFPLAIEAWEFQLENKRDSFV